MSKAGIYNVVEAHCYVLDIGPTDREQIHSRINNNWCRMFWPRRPLSTAYKTVLYAVDKGLCGRNVLHQFLLILLHICSRSVCPIQVYVVWSKCLHDNLQQCKDYTICILINWKIDRIELSKFNVSYWYSSCPSLSLDGHMGSRFDLGLCSRYHQSFWCIYIASLTLLLYQCTTCSSTDVSLHWMLDYSITIIIAI